MKTCALFKQLAGAGARGAGPGAQGPARFRKSSSPRATDEDMQIRRYPRYFAEKGRVKPFCLSYVCVLCTYIVGISDSL